MMHRTDCFLHCFRSGGLMGEFQLVLNVIHFPLKLLNQRNNYRPLSRQFMHFTKKVIIWFRCANSWYLVYVSSGNGWLESPFVLAWVSNQNSWELPGCAAPLNWTDCCLTQMQGPVSLSRRILPARSHKIALSWLRFSSLHLQDDTAERWQHPSMHITWIVTFLQTWGDYICFTSWPDSGQRSHRVDADNLDRRIAFC